MYDLSAKFEVFRPVLKVYIFWDVTLCALVSSSQNFGLSLLCNHGLAIQGDGSI